MSIPKHTEHHLPLTTAHLWRSWEDATNTRPRGRANRDASTVSRPSEVGVTIELHEYSRQTSGEEWRGANGERGFFR